MGSIPNYQDAANWPNLETMVGSEGQIYVKVYNNSTALSNGAIKVLSYYVDATDTSNPIIKGILVAPSTQAGYNNVVCVVDNSPKDKTTIAASTYGWVVIRGYVQALVNAVTSIAVGDQLQVISAGTAFIPQGTTATSGASPILATESSAIAMEAYVTATDALKKVFLTGLPCVIAAT